MSGGTCREQSSTDASDSSICGSNCVSRPERASGSSRKISRRKGIFPVAPIPVADIPRSHSFHSPVVSDDSGRNSREETTGSTGDKKSTPLGESGTTSCGEKRKIPQPETLADSDTSDHRSRSGAIQTTGGWAMRISDCPHSIEHRAFRENAYLEWMTCLSCGARWSRQTGQDDIQVKMGLITEQPQLTPPCPGCASTPRLQQMTNKTETFFGCSRFPLCKRVENISYYGITCFTVCALVFGSSAFGGAGNGTGLRFSRVGRELHNVECTSRTSRITTGTTIPTGTATASFIFWHHGSGSTTGDRSNATRPTAEGQGEQGSPDIARHKCKRSEHHGSAAECPCVDRQNRCRRRYLGSCNSTLQQSQCVILLSDGDRQGMSATIGFRRLNLRGIHWQSCENAAGAWDFAVKTNVSQNRCRVFGKSPWWDLSCDDDVWLHERATMNRAQNSFVDEQLAQIQSAHDELRCYFADHNTMQIRPASTYDLIAESRIYLLDLRDAPNRELEAIRQHKERATIHVDSTTQR